MNLADNNYLLESQWNIQGHSYAKEINAHQAFIEEHGMPDWMGKEPADKRDELALEVLALLKKANREGTIDTFRASYPPAYAPFINIIQEQGQNIENLCYINEDTIAFVIGSAYEKRKAYVLTNRNIEKLSDSIRAIGRSHLNNIYAIAKTNSITTYKNWEGRKIFEFKLPPVVVLPISQLIPFNDGLSVLLISSEGIYLLTTQGHSMIHPVPDLEDKDWSSYIDMEHAALSYDNSLIVVGDQTSAHRILNRDGNHIATIDPHSSYPHYALFSKDGQQILLNSCHSCDGTTISVPATGIHTIKRGDDSHTIIDNSCRVYAAATTAEHYIFGDAHGNLQAFDKEGKKSWSYFIGSIITGMTLSEDEKTLWVASGSGMVHKLKLNGEQPDDHTIGNGNINEEFRVIFWKNEPEPLVW
ncbi:MULTISPECIES: WD40 repeat domain-containing protein [Niastella]|uniref:SMP-30/Gluconolactonase/LRE-like region domain-containing protein n=1 Tax=Niastella soli TaxID=2821487 RepID=A0ABS3YLD6_9BACT|nr:hypothetical protein [Niastella soli]MBO9198698.1 hypothetical protein [Niastella soli]